MVGSGSTCWDLIDAAARGEDDGRAQFAALYGGLVRSFLRSLWRDKPWLDDLDDAVQDVFVECMRPGGVLQAADRQRPEGFRAFLHGVARNVARRYESRATKNEARVRSLGGSQEALVAVEESQSRLFDREWARSMVRAAAGSMAERAERLGESARLRVRLLRARFEDDLSIQRIAQQWEIEAAALHRQYAKARREFKEALLHVVARHFPGTREQVERECNRLLDLLE